MKKVFRESEDKLSRQRWTFTETVDRIVLTDYAIERRSSPRGRFKSPKHGESWSNMDERSYASGISRPTDIPIDVIKEALTRDVDVNIGWHNKESVILTVKTTPIWGKS